MKKLSDQPLKPILLIVDDEEGPRMSLKVVFKDDYSVLLAETGAQAIRLAQENQVDVVISDIRMPEMSGIELLGKLKSIDPKIEVIMLTAYSASRNSRARSWAAPNI